MSINTEKTYKIGTRGSPLAVIQADEVKSKLQAEYPDLKNKNLIEIVKIVTSGDLNQDKPLYEIGGKGLFSKEIDKALVKGEIDIAVHSLKDLETALDERTLLCAVLKREDYRDVMLSTKSVSFDKLLVGSVIGTSSPRRRAQILNLFPHLNCVPIRGNLQTRLKKLERNEVDAIVLAMAGLKRLGLSSSITEIIEPELMLPAVSQGAIGITCRKDDKDVIPLITKINDANTMGCVKSERAMLAALGGSCRTPIAGLAKIVDGEKLWLRGAILEPDGSKHFHTSRYGVLSEAEALGFDVGYELKSRSGFGPFNANK